MAVTVGELLAQAEQRWGRGTLVRLGDLLHGAEGVEAIPTGFPALDAALGVGGLPCGRISEIFGPESSGKQALVAHLVAQCQRVEGVAACVDPGRRLDPEQMRAQGVDFRSLLVARPVEGLQALEMAIRLARAGGLKLLVLDARRSALRTPPAALGLALRRLVSAVDKNRVAFVFLSDGGDQRLRGNAGEQALRFFASVRVGLERREWVRRGRETVGCRSLARVAKNKLAPPDREAEVELLFYRFPPAAPVLQLWAPGQSAWRSDGHDSARVAEAVPLASTPLPHSWPLPDAVPARIAASGR